MFPRTILPRSVAIVLGFAVAGCTALSEIDDSDYPAVVEAGPSKSTSLLSTGYRQQRISGPATRAGAGAAALSGAELYFADGNGAEGSAEPGSGPRRDRTGEVNLSFVDAKIKDVVDIILGDILEYNYSINTDLGGTITARSNRLIPRDRLIPVLENILALNGAALIEANGIWYVVALETSNQLPPRVVAPNRKGVSEGHGVHFIQLEYAPVTSVAEIVGGQVSPGRQFVSDPDRNMMIFVGPAQEARAIEAMVAALDIDVLKDRSFALFPVQAASPAEIVKELDSVYGAAAGSSVQFVPIDRLSAVLAVARNKRYLRKARVWIERLDRADQGTRRQVFVYYIKHGRAAELAETLTGLYSGSERATGGAVVAPTLQPEEIGQDGEAAPSGTRLASVSDTGGSGDVPTILADERNNALVIKATPDQYRDMEAILQRLDIVPLQVMIEVVVAEVSLDGTLKFGVEWFLKSGAFSGTFSTLGSGEVTNSFPGFGFTFETANAKVVLNALDRVTDVDVISSPKLTVLDNQSARLQVGDQVPVATRTAVATDASAASIVNDVELVDTGVILEVKPTVNTGGMVSLNVVQEVSEATTTLTSDIDSPTIQTRRIESVLAVQSGETVALAGLMRDRVERGEIGIPVVKDIPVVGNLFKSRTTNTDRTELIVLITPHVLRDPNEMRQVTNELRSRLSTISTF